MRIRNALRDDCFVLGEIIDSAERSAFDGRVPEACLSELSLEQRAANWRRFFDSGSTQRGDEVLFVAEASPDEVVGFILAGRATAETVHDASVAAIYRREITVLQVAPAWQRCGVGRALVSAAATWFVERGQRSISVLVVESNPNRPFYSRLGARELSVQPYDWAGYATRQVVYGWLDIGVLCGAA
jgi:GNAT superfamily N-acetyltransferase